MVISTVWPDVCDEETVLRRLLLPDTSGTVSRTPRAHKRTFPDGTAKTRVLGKRGKQEAAAAEPLVLTF